MITKHQLTYKVETEENQHKADSAFEYGIMCDAGLGAQKVGGTDGPRAGFGGTADNDVTTNPSYYQGFSTGDGGFSNHYCQDTVDTSDQDTGGQVQILCLRRSSTAKH